MPIYAETITTPKWTTHPTVQECFLHNRETFRLFPSFLFYFFLKSRSSESVIYRTIGANNGSNVQFFYVFTLADKRPSRLGEGVLFQSDEITPAAIHTVQF